VYSGKINLNASSYCYFYGSSNGGSLSNCSFKYSGGINLSTSSLCSFSGGNSSSLENCSIEYFENSVINLNSSSSTNDKDFSIYGATSSGKVDNSSIRYLGAVNVNYGSNSSDPGTGDVHFYSISSTGSIQNCSVEWSGTAFLKRGGDCSFSIFSQSTTSNYSFATPKGKSGGSITLKSTNETSTIKTYTFYGGSRAGTLQNCSVDYSGDIVLDAQSGTVNSCIFFGGNNTSGAAFIRNCSLAYSGDINLNASSTCTFCGGPGSDTDSATITNTSINYLGTIDMVATSSTNFYGFGTYKYPANTFTISNSDIQYNIVTIPVSSNLDNNSSPSAYAHAGNSFTIKELKLTGEPTGSQSIWIYKYMEDGGSISKGKENTADVTIKVVEENDRIIKIDKAKMYESVPIYTPQSALDTPTPPTDPAPGQEPEKPAPPVEETPVKRSKKNRQTK
jgi:hypothetical protein